MSENHLLKHETLNLKIDSISLLMILFHMLILFYSVSNIHEHTRISSDFLALSFWWPAIRKPHSENVRSKQALPGDVQPAVPVAYISVVVASRSQKHHMEQWRMNPDILLWLCADSAALEWTADTDGTVCCWTDILLARNLNCCNNTVEWILAEASILSWDWGPDHQRWSLRAQPGVVLGWV